MNGMIERVTFALERAGIDSYMEGDYEGLARAAIAAMREPTEAMIEACGADDYYDSYERRRANWETMIDTVLLEVGSDVGE